MDIYILIIMTTLDGEPDLTSRLIEVEKTASHFIIHKSEYSYLGEGKMIGELKEDEDGLHHFRFVSNEEEPREFFCDDSEDSDYIIGDVLEGGEEVGEFILRNVSLAKL